MSAPSGRPAGPGYGAEPGYDAAHLSGLIADFADFPRPGVLFKDISPLLADADGFARLVAAVAELASDVDLVAGVEARGFMIAAPVAAAAGLGFVPLRKAGKLPGRTRRASYALEYGTAELELRPDVLPAGARVLLVDDVLATGGTLVAAAELLEACGADVVRVAVLMEIVALRGREQLVGRELHALLQA